MKDELSADFQAIVKERDAMKNLLERFAKQAPIYGPEVADSEYLTKLPWPIRMTVGDVRLAAKLVYGE